MGTASVVVRGKGNPVALNSPPRGAGRVYSPSPSRRTLNGSELRAAMVGIECRDCDQFIDEIPTAYSSIDGVTCDTGDHVEIRELHQVANAEGA